MGSQVTRDYFEMDKRDLTCITRSGTSGTSHGTIGRDGQEILDLGPSGCLMGSHPCDPGLCDRIDKRDLYCILALGTGGTYHEIPRWYHGTMG